MRKYLIALITLIIGGFGIWFVYRNIPFLDVLRSYSTDKLLLLIPYFIVSLLITVILVLRWDYILKRQNIKVPFNHLFLYRFVANAVSYVTPSAKLGGEFMRALLLGRHKVPMKKAFSTVVIDKSLELSFHALFFTIGIVFVVLNFAFPAETKGYFIFLAFVFAFLFALFYYYALMEKKIFRKIYETLRLHKFQTIRKYESKIFDFDRQVVEFFHKDKKDFAVAMALSALSWGLSFVEFKLALLIVGINATIVQIFLIYSFVGIAYIIPIPMALGSLEGSQISIFSILRLSRAVSVALSLLIRVRDTLFTIIGFLLLGYFGLNFKGVMYKAFRK